MHLVKMLSHQERIAAVDGRVVAVVNDEPAAVRAAMLRDLEVPFPVAFDLERETYRAWGLGRLPAARAFAPRLLLDYVRMIRGGERLRRPGADLLQLGGDFVLAPDGTVAHAHPQENADDRPPVGLLVRELEAAARR